MHQKKVIKVKKVETQMSFNRSGSRDSDHRMHELKIDRDEDHRKTIKSDMTRYMPQRTTLAINDPEQTAVLYEKWRANPNLMISKQKVGQNKTFRETHNSMYNSGGAAQVNDKVFTDNLLSGKTYFTSLKEHVFMQP